MGQKMRRTPPIQKNNKAEKKHLDSSKVTIPMGSSSDLDKERDGFTTAVE